MSRQRGASRFGACGAGDGMFAAPVYIPIVQNERAIRKLYGDEGHGAFESFQEELRSTWISRPGLTDQQKLDMILTHLGPIAREEVECRPQEVKCDPEAVLRVLSEEFGDRRKCRDLRWEFDGTKQREGESLREFAHRLQRVWRSLCQAQQREAEKVSTDLDMRTHFARNVRCAILRAHLDQQNALKPDQTFLDLRKEASRFMDAQGAYHDDIVAVRRIQGPPPPAQNQAAAPVQDTTQEKLEQLTKCMTQSLQALTKVVERLSLGQGGRGRGRPHNRCYNCDAEGHLARFCPALQQQGNGPPARK